VICLNQEKKCLALCRNQVIIKSLVSLSYNFLIFFIFYIERLNKLNLQNSKFLQKLSTIHDGRYLSVGHHRVHEESKRKKTLNIDRVKLLNESIDSDNKKIGKAIQTARPIVPLHNDFKAMGNQVKYLKLISLKPSF